MTQKTELQVKRFIHDARQLLGGNLLRVVLFGSAARGDAVVESDIDLLFIVDHLSYGTRKALSALASDYSIEQGVFISPILKERNVWELNETHNTLFYQEIERDGIVL